MAPASQRLSESKKTREDTRRLVHCYIYASGVRKGDDPLSLRWARSDVGMASNDGITPRRIHDPNSGEVRPDRVGHLPTVGGTASIAPSELNSTSAYHTDV